MRTQRTLPSCPGRHKQWRKKVKNSIRMNEKRTKKGPTSKQVKILLCWRNKNRFPTLPSRDCQRQHTRRKKEGKCKREGTQTANQKNLNCHF
jgi:hypothetical protein